MFDKIGNKSIIMNRKRKKGFNLTLTLLFITLIILNMFIYKAKEHHSTLYTRNEYLTKNSYIGKHKLKSKENRRTLLTYIFMIVFLILIIII